MRADAMGFFKEYADKSGVESQVALQCDVIILERHGHQLEFPLDQLDWMIASLKRIQQEVS